MKLAVLFVSALLSCPTAAANKADAPPYSPPFDPIPYGLTGAGDPRDCEGENLLALADYWIKELRLEDWDFVFSCSTPDFAPPGTIGYSRTDVTSRRAVIWISKGFPNEPKSQTLAHELLHVLLNLASESNSHLVMEQIVRTLETVIWTREVVAREKLKP